MRSTACWAVRKTAASIAALLLLGASLAHATAPPIFVPADDSVVLARVPQSFGGWQQDQLTSGAPGALSAAMAQVSRSGDARLAGRLQKHLDGLPADTMDADVILARAWLAQHQHRFDDSRQQLDRLLAGQPGNDNALAMRAHLSLTQGRLRDAQKDCAALLFIEPRQATLCAGRLAGRRGDWDAAERVLSRLQVGDDAVARDARLLSAELAGARGDAVAGERFTAARAAAPGDWRPLLAHARWLRRNGRASDALAILPQDSTHDGLALERAMAAAAVKAPDAQRLLSRLVARYAAARQAGANPESRDESELALLAGDSVRALELAKENFATQRDMEDVELLERAAAVAQRPDALVMLREWERLEGVRQPAGG